MGQLALFAGEQYKKKQLADGGSIQRMPTSSLSPQSALETNLKTTANAMI